MPIGWKKSLILAQDAKRMKICGKALGVSWPKPRPGLHSSWYPLGFSTDCPSVECTVYTVHLAAYTVQCTLCSFHRSLFIVQCPMFTINCTINTVYCTLYTILYFCILHCRRGEVCQECFWDLFPCVKERISLMKTVRTPKIAKNGPTQHNKLFFARRAKKA